MQTCPSCGHQRVKDEMRCPECGNFYSKIIELIEAEATAEENSTLKGCYKRIINSDNIKQALRDEFSAQWAGLSWRAKFTLFVIFAFVFALVVSVL